KVILTRPCSAAGLCYVFIRFCVESNRAGYGGRVDHKLAVHRQMGPATKQPQRIKAADGDTWRDDDPPFTGEIIKLYRVSQIVHIYPGLFCLMSKMQKQLSVPLPGIQP